MDSTQDNKLPESVIKPFRDAPTDVDFDIEQQELTLVIYVIGDDWVEENQFPLKINEAQKFALKILDTCAMLRLHEQLLNHPD